MAAGNFKPYVPGIENIADGLIDIDTHTFVVTLHTSAYTPNQNTHSTWADVSGSEVANGNGYTSGGQTIAIGSTRTGNEVFVTAPASSSWPASTITAKYAVVSKRAGGSLVAGDLILGYVDLETGQAGGIGSSNAAFTVNWNASGLFKMTVN